MCSWAQTVRSSSTGETWTNSSRGTKSGHRCEPCGKPVDNGATLAVDHHACRLVRSRSTDDSKEKPARGRVGQARRIRQDEETLSVREKRARQERRKCEVCKPKPRGALKDREAGCGDTRAPAPREEGKDSWQGVEAQAAFSNVRAARPGRSNSPPAAGQSAKRPASAITPRR